MKALRSAAPDRKAELYRGLGLRIEWSPKIRDQVSVELPLGMYTDGRVGGAFAPCNPPSITADLILPTVQR